MLRTLAYRDFRSVAGLVLGMVLGVASVSGQEVVRLYGPLGPMPAFKEAAMAFEDQEGVVIEVVGQEIEEWIDRARSDADLVYSSAEYMMSTFIADPELDIDPATITPLYLRPSAILVRPGNPKHIRDFPDLLEPGMRVMVVTGSGQTGLWEDMAGKTGDVRTIRALRRNIVHFARNSDEAQRLWLQHPDIDAWLTWSIWFMPVRQQAEHVPVSRNYVMYRQSSIAMTTRGLAKPAAVRFVEFLTSAQGARIFNSWGWLPPAPADSALAIRNDICAVCRIKNDQWQDGIGFGLTCLRGLLEDYRVAGVPQQEIHISAVFHGPAAYWLLNDQAYASFTGRTGGNPNRMVVQELIDAGVSMEMCGQTMARAGWSQSDLLPGVKVVVGAYPRIIDLELQGYAYLRF